MFKFALDFTVAAMLFSRHYLFRCFFLITLPLLTFTTPEIFGQNAPVTTATTIANASAGTVTVPLTVTGFSNIGAISLTIDYNYSVMTFIQGIKNPLLPGTFTISDIELESGLHRITMGWFGSGVSLADGSAIMTLYFNFISGVTSLNWFDSGGSCEYADINYFPLNDIPTEDFYINGAVCGAIGTTGPVNGNNTVCQGQTGEPYSIAPVVNATGYTWSVPEGALIITGQNTNTITVDFMDSAQSGQVAVYAINPCSSGSPATLDVTVNVLPVANAGNDFTMPYGTSTTLQAAPGGPGAYGYQWSPEELLINPYSQNPQTVIMTYSAIFTVTVTDLATLCSNNDEVTVNVTGGPLSINPVAVPGEICIGESVQLYSNVSGGSGIYTYAWTCIPPGNPPWSSLLPDPVVIPEISTQYLLEVNDGYSVVMDMTSVEVFPLPTAAISGSDTLCGEGDNTSLRVDLTGMPPWNFTYSFGSTSVFVNNQTTTPYFIITGEEGTYTITYVEDTHCTGTTYGTAHVWIFPVPPTPEVTYNNLVLSSDACCGNQWYLDNIAIPGADEQTYTVNVSGSYYDIVTLNGCSSASSEAIDVIVGIEEKEKYSTSFYPNPANEKIYIHPGSNLQYPLTIGIYSASGILIRSDFMKNTTHDDPMTVDDLPSGLYYIRISGTNAQSAGKLVISH